MRAFVVLFRRNLIEVVDDSPAPWNALAPIICTDCYELIEKLGSAKITGIITNRSLIPVKDRFHFCTDAEVSLCEILKCHNKLADERSKR